MKKKAVSKRKARKTPSPSSGVTAAQLKAHKKKNRTQVDYDGSINYINNFLNKLGKK